MLLKGLSAHGKHPKVTQIVFTMKHAMLYLQPAIVSKQLLSIIFSDNRDDFENRSCLIKL